MAQPSSNHEIGVMAFAFLLLLLTAIMQFKETIKRSVSATAPVTTHLVSDSQELQLVTGHAFNKTQPAPQAGPAHTPFFFMPVPVNDASEELLATLPGIGPATAARIVEYRKEKGRVNSIDQLLSVKGIGDEKLVRIKPHLSVQ